MTNWEKLYSARAGRMKASDIREAFKLAERGDIISFAGGFPAPETFPCEEVAEVASQIARLEGATSLQYGPTEGLYALRELIAERLHRQGIACTAEEVLITNGSQQALDLIGKVPRSRRRSHRRAAGLHRWRRCIGSIRGGLCGRAHGYGGPAGGAISPKAQRTQGTRRCHTRESVLHCNQLPKSVSASRSVWPDAGLY